MRSHHRSLRLLLSAIRTKHVHYISGIRCAVDVGTILPFFIKCILYRTYFFLFTSVGHISRRSNSRKRCFVCMKSLTVDTCLYHHLLYCIYSSCTMVLVRCQLSSLSLPLCLLSIVNILGRMLFTKPLH